MNTIAVFVGRIVAGRGLEHDAVCDSFEAICGGVEDRARWAAFRAVRDSCTPSLRPQLVGQSRAVSTTGTLIPEVVDSMQVDWESL